MNHLSQNLLIGTIAPTWNKKLYTVTYLCHNLLTRTHEHQATNNKVVGVTICSPEHMNITGTPTMNNKCHNLPPIIIIIIIIADINKVPFLSRTHSYRYIQHLQYTMHRQQSHLIMCNLLTKHIQTLKPVKCLENQQQAINCFTICSPELMHTLATPTLHTLPDVFKTQNQLASCRCIIVFSFSSLIPVHKQELSWLRD